MWLDQFCQRGKADVIVGGQWGSEGKGAAAAYLARRLAEGFRSYDVYSTNAGAQAGHTSVHRGRKRVVFHLPTAALIARDHDFPGLIHLNGGSIIDPDVLEQELKDNDLTTTDVQIHANAAVITQDCKDAEGLAHSVQTKIASTRKGVGEALARKVLRSGVIAKDHPFLRQFVRPIPWRMLSIDRVLVEVPQGIGLSVDGQFYPHCTSRNCTLQQGLADAGIHPRQFGASMLVLRTTPIRVGNIVESLSIDTPFGAVRSKPTVLGTSGGYYADQRELSWNELGVPPEITTVTKRVRRVFSFSGRQAREAIMLTRPDVVHLTFCDYPVNVAEITISIINTAEHFRLEPKVLFQYGPTTDDVQEEM